MKKPGYRVSGYVVLVLLVQLLVPLLPPAAAAAPASVKAAPWPDQLAITTGVVEAAPVQPAAPSVALSDLRMPGPDRPELEPPAAPLDRPLARTIPQALLTVNVFGPAVASLGAPVGSGEIYTAVIRNNSSQIAYGVYLTATFPSFFVYDGGSRLISSTADIPVTVTPGANSLTWTPALTLNLAAGETITLTWSLRAACDAQSGQQMRVGIYYNADPPPAAAVELNTGGLNITTGRGNLVLKKEPPLHNLSTDDYGQPITWVVTLQNTGLGKLFNAVITDNGGIDLAPPVLTPPTRTIPVLDVNQVITYLAVGTVESCNLTNVALASWECGNLVGDATPANPVSSTTSVLFSPDLPAVSIEALPSFDLPYCAVVTHELTVWLHNSGGPAADFYLDSNLENDTFLQVVTVSLDSAWSYDPAEGTFAYQGALPAGTLYPTAPGAPISLTFQVRPRQELICTEGEGELVFTPRYRDICQATPFTGTAQTANYTYGGGEAPSIEVVKSGPGVVSGGRVYSYVLSILGRHPAQMAAPVYITDQVPAQLALTGAFTSSIGSANVAGQTVTWQFDPTGLSDPFLQTLVYEVTAITDTDGLCGATQLVQNDVQAVVVPTCTGCPSCTGASQVDTAIENNEQVSTGYATAGSFEACGPTGFTIVKNYAITGSTIVNWNGATFTEALGTDIGAGALPPGAAPLIYEPGSLVAVIVTSDATDYTALLTPVIAPGGQLVIDLSPLTAAGAPTQNLTLWLTYTVQIPEASLDGQVDQVFFDWSQLYLPGISDNDACASNNSFNQTIPLSIGRGALGIDIDPLILDRCRSNPVRITVSDQTPGRLTDHIVVTFTASSAEIASARDFTFTGSLAGLLPTIASDDDIGGGRGIITFTFPSAADLDGNGQIQFLVDVNCSAGMDWTGGIGYQSLCGVTYEALDIQPHEYRAANLILFTTPIEYTVREKEVVWKFFVANSGNLTATDVVVTNTFSGMAVLSYTADGGPAIVPAPALPVTAPTPVVFAIGDLPPHTQRAVTVTALVLSCSPLWVNVQADQPCFATSCGSPSSPVYMNTPDPYLLTNNGETADLPMCDIGEVIFTTKNASPDVYLYGVDITETLRSLYPVPGAPITVTVWDSANHMIAETSSFVPLTFMAGSDLQLVWRASLATAGVVTWFNALPPLYVIRIYVPVRIDCVPPNTPQSFASAAARGPCNKLLSYEETARTLQTMRPDMAVDKMGAVDGGEYGETVYATPGQTVTWRIRIYNRDTDHSYIAYHVVLSDTWPDNFEYVASSVSASQPITPHLLLASRTITWDVGSMAQSGEPFTFYITGTIATAADSCAAVTDNRARLTFGCDMGCTSALVPQDSASLDTRPDLHIAVGPDPLDTCGDQIPITISNWGARAFTNTLTITLPVPGYVYAGLVYSDLPPDYITPSLDAPQFGWDMIPGRTGSAPYEFTMIIRVNNSGSTGMCPASDDLPVVAVMNYDNHPICLDPGPWTATDAVSLDVLTPVLQIDKSPRTQTANVGQVVSWTITLTNAGDGWAENVVVTDVVGSNFGGVAATAGSGGVVPTIDGQLITWTLPFSLASGAVWSASVSATLSDTGDNRNVVAASSICATGCRPAAVVSDTAFTTLLQEFQKNPPAQEGTIGSLVVFTFTTFLPDVDAVYEDMAVVDQLPAGLGYQSAVLTYTWDGDGSATTVISYTPTIAPGSSLPGDVTWQLGDVPGTVQISGIITAVIRDIPSNQDGTHLDNQIRLTYMDDGQPYVYTDTAGVDVVESLLVLDKRVSSSTGQTSGLDGNAYLTYTIVITNTGHNPAYNVWISDVLPAGISLTAVYGGDSHSTPIQGPGTITWSAALIDETLPGSNNPLILTYTACLSGALASAALANVVTTTWTSLPGEEPGERLYTPITDQVTISTASPTLVKTVTPGSSTTNPLRLGDVVTYTLVTRVPAGLLVPWPFQYDDLPRGVRYVAGTWNVTSTMPFIGTGPLADSGPYNSSPNGVQGAVSASNPRVGGSETNTAIETVEWWFDPLDNSDRGGPGLVTVTLQAQLTGIDRNGAIQWTDPQAAATLNNVTRLYWNQRNHGIYSPTQPLQTLSASASSYVGQPLSHIAKTYLTGAVETATLLQDSFNRTTLGPAWSTLVGAWAINTNPGYVRFTGGAATATRLVHTGSYETDLSYSAMLYSTDSTSSYGLILHYIDPNNYDLVLLRDNDGGTDVQLRQIVGGVTTVLASSTAVQPTTNRWYHVEARADRGHWQVLVNGALIIDTVDPTPSNGLQIGIYGNNCSDNACRYDDVMVTRFGSSGHLVGAGQEITFTLTISNQGITPAYNVVVSDVLPPELTLVSSALVSAPPGTTLVAQPAPGAAGVITWEIDVLPGTAPGSMTTGNQKTVQIQVVVRVTDTVTANMHFSNQAFLPYYDSQPAAGPTGTPISSGTDSDQRTYNDGSHSAGLRTADGGPAKVAEFAPPPAATLGTLITYTISVPSQPLSSTLYHVVLADVLDSRLYVASAAASGGTNPLLVQDGQAITVTWDQIASYTQAYITITACISHEHPLPGSDARDGDQIVNTAIMTHATAAEIATTHPVTVEVHEPQTSINKQAALLPDMQQAVYTLTVTNQGTSPAYSLIVTDSLPVGVQVTTLSAGGALLPDGRTLTWTLPFLGMPPANTAVFTYSVRLISAVYTGDVFTNTAFVRSTSLTDTVPGVRDYVTDTMHGLTWPLGRLGDYVWYDQDYDGLQDENPAVYGIGGVIVELIDSATGAVISTTTTDSSGWYLFEHLPLGIGYTVRISTTSYLPAGSPLYTYTQTLLETAGTGPGTDSNAAITATYEGLGYAISTTLTSVMTEDLTLDYGFVHLIEIGNYIWIDANQDGLQNDGPASGLNGIQVTATYPNGQMVTTTTGAGGYYTFAVPAGYAFTITVPLQGPLQGYTQTLPHQGGDDALDSDGELASDGWTIVTPVITADDYRFDMGFFELVALGSRIWLDTGVGGGVPDNGIQDGAEHGIAGVVVQLFAAGQTPGVDAPIATTTTDANGDYWFDNLIPGTYFVHLPPEMFAPGGPLDGYLSSTGNGADEMTDQIGDENGVDNFTLATTGISSTLYVLTPGAEVTGEDQASYPGVLDDDNVNGTADLGFTALGHIGDYVWLELNDNGVQGDGDEAPISGVIVDLYNADTGAWIASTTTDENGYYLFDELGLGITYTVQLSSANWLPGGALVTYTQTTLGAGTTDTDSDANPAALWNGSGYAVTTTLLTLSPLVTEDLSLDFGFWQPAASVLGVGKSVAPAVAANGQTITYTLWLTNQASITLTQVAVTDTLPAGLTYIGPAQPITPDLVSGLTVVWYDASGGLGLPPGAALVLTMPVRVETGVGVTGTYVNQVAGSAEYPGGTVTDTAEVPILVTNPAVEIAKEVAAPGYVVDGLIAFTIRITNTGPSALEVVPLTDQFTGPVAYEGSTPLPNLVDQASGLLTWHDLTQPAPYGLGSNLAPGQSFVITTVFRVLTAAESLTMTNLARVSGVRDTYNNPAEDDEHDVLLIDVPTAIDLLYWRGTSKAGGVLLEWATAVEINNYGFSLRRSTSGAWEEAIEIAFVPAAGREQLGGASYSYLDQTATETGTYHYWLVDVDTAGKETIHGPLAITVVLHGELPYRIYLPLVLFE